MANITRWNPYDDLMRMRETFNGFMDNMLPALWGWGNDYLKNGYWGPSVDVRETDKEMIVSAEIPGVDPEDIDITVTEDAVSFRGEVKHEADVSERGYRRRERRYGSFYRTIPLPEQAKPDEAVASYKNGILSVTVPKNEAAKSRVKKLRLTGETH